MSEMEIQPKITEIVTPSIDVITSMGKVACNWANTNMIRLEDPYENHIEYNDGETLHSLNVLGDDWDKLVEADFPWEYFPDMSRFTEEDVIEVVMPTQEKLKFRPRNTTLRLFKDQTYNHVDHYINPSELRGIKVVPALWRMMFKGNFPIKYLPYIDKASKDWFENLRKDPS